MYSVCQQRIGAAVGSVEVSNASVGSESESESEEELMPAAEVEANVRAKLPPFEPFSPVSTGSKGDMRLKVR